MFILTPRTEIEMDGSERNKRTMNPSNIVSYHDILKATNIDCSLFYLLPLEL